MDGFGLQGIYKYPGYQIWIFLKISLKVELQFHNLNWSWMQTNCLTVIYGETLTDKFPPVCGRMYVALEDYIEVSIKETKRFLIKKTKRFFIMKHFFPNCFIINFTFLLCCLDTIYLK